MELIKKDVYMKAKAFAKVNLSLEVLRLREDGYYEVATLLQTVDLSDDLYFEASPYIEVSCSVPELSGPDNLVHKAATVLQETFSYKFGAKIYVKKNIPISMGLGGGSSDAAAALVALNHLWGINVSSSTLEVIARRIGVDVAFFVNGGTAVGIGRGDEINSINEPIHLWILLVCPNLSIGSKTRTLYSRVRPNLFTSGQITRGLSLLVSDPVRLTEGLYNAFEPLAFDVFDGLNQVVSDMCKAGIKNPNLSGTGPCLYGFVSDQQQGIRIRKQLVELGYIVHLVRTTQSSSLLTLGQSNN